MSRTFHHGDACREKPWVKKPLWSWLSVEPWWWTNLYHTRPKRNANRRLVADIRLGCVDPDGVPYPLGNRKPHVYYW